MRTCLFVFVAMASAFPALANSLDFAMGKALFDRAWTVAPSSTLATDGLGPLFNARSCVACHKGGGRGDLNIDASGMARGTGFVMRIGDRAGTGDPVYGVQLQTISMQGIQHEGDVHLDKNTNRLSVVDWHYGPLKDGYFIAPRLSQPLHGLGLLEQVEVSVLEELADPEDRNHDGISGRINRIPGPNGTMLAGRFNWKAGAADLMTQTANAFRNDIGMSSPLRMDHAGDCTPTQHTCRTAPHGNSPQFDDTEISQEMLRLVTVYLQGLKPPPAPQDLNGLDLFYDTGCSQCHMPILPLPGGRKLRAYTDLLIHDMGEALADDIGEGSATGREWRTQPLWGLGLAVKKGQRLLHDARAATIEDAILWHGGEAGNAASNFKELNQADKTRLLDFLHRL